MKRAHVNPHRWWALVGVCGAAALVWLAFAEVGVALPTIGEHVPGPLTRLQWINNAFGLACGALVLGAGCSAGEHCSGSSCR